MPLPASSLRPFPQAPALLRIAALLLVATSLAAADKPDLSRDTPVPATEPIPLQDFLRPLILAQPKINHAGSHIAAIVAAGEDRHQLLVYNLNTQKSEVMGGYGEKDISDFTWLDDSRLVFELWVRKNMIVGLMAGEVGQLQNSHPLLQYAGTRIVAVPPKNRLQPLVWNRYNIETGRDDGAAIINPDLHLGILVDLGGIGVDPSAAQDISKNNERHVLQRYPVPPDGLTERYLADRDGQLAYAITSEKGVRTMHRWDRSQWIRCPVNLDHITVVDAGNLPGQVVVIGPRDGTKPRALQFMDAATGQLGDVLLQDKEYDFNGWLYRDPATQDIIGAMFDRNGPRSVWFNDNYKSLQKVLDGFFPGLVVRIIGSDDAQNLFLVACYSDRQPVIYNWVNLEKRAAGLFKNSAPWIDPKRMQPVNIIKFKTRDGRSLDAYLTLPAGATKENPPPLVVLPHGYPWARDRWAFSFDAQFLASRGYAVLRPNYRGSEGYGWMFTLEEEWDFRKMSDDVADATRTVAASGLVDPKRIGIMGNAFGAYLATAGVTHEPDLYRCAIVIAGTYDWQDWLREEKYYEFEYTTYGRYARWLGDPKSQPEKFAAISPVRHADKIRVPVLVATDRGELEAAIAQSKRMISELERHRVPHESLYLGDDRRGLSYLTNQLELYSHIEKFLDKHLMPKR